MEGVQHIAHWKSVSGPWLGPRAPRCHLIALVEESSGACSARLAQDDSSDENLRLLRDYVLQFGIPKVVETNRKTLFRGNPRNASDPGNSRIRRTLGDLGVLWRGGEKPASPAMHAFFRIAASALPRELQQARAVSIEAANRRLASTYLQAWNAGRDCPQGSRIEADVFATVFSRVTLRALHPGGVFQYNGANYRVDAPLSTDPFIRIEERLDGGVIATVGGVPVTLLPYESRHQSPAPRPAPRAPRRQTTRPANKAWMENFFKTPQRPLWHILKPLRSSDL